MFTPSATLAQQRSVFDRLSSAYVSAAFAAVMAAAAARKLQKDIEVVLKKGSLVRFDMIPFELTEGSCGVISFFFK